MLKKMTLLLPLLLGACGNDAGITITSFSPKANGLEVKIVFKSSLKDAVTASATAGFIHLKKDGHAACSLKVAANATITGGEAVTDTSAERTITFETTLDNDTTNNINKCAVGTDSLPGAGETTTAKFVTAGQILVGTTKFPATVASGTVY